MNVSKCEESIQRSDRHITARVIKIKLILSPWNGWPPPWIRPLYITAEYSCVLIQMGVEVTLCWAEPCPIAMLVSPVDSTNIWWLRQFREQRNSALLSGERVYMGFRDDLCQKGRAWVSSKAFCSSCVPCTINKVQTGWISDTQKTEKNFTSRELTFANFLQNVIHPFPG